MSQSLTPSASRDGGGRRDTGRMDISARADYAVRAMLALAASEGGAPCSVVRLAQEQDLPRKFLEAILGDLRRAALVTSRLGATGGYVLARPAGDICIGDVIRAVDGPLAEVRGERPQTTSYVGAAAHLPTLWVAVRASVRSVLDATTLADVVAGDFPTSVRQALELPGSWENR